MKKDKIKRKTLEQKGFKELIKVLDKVYSEYIRLRTSDSNGYCRCITCGRVYHWKSLDCGHFIGRGNYSVRFNELNTAPQCVECNSYNGGERVKFEKTLINIHGIEAVEELKRIAKQEERPTNEELRKMIIMYKEKLKILLIEKL